MRALCAPVAALALVLAGCGGGDDEPRETRDADRPPLIRGGPDPEAFERFQKCLEENGVEAPEPSDDGPQLVQPPPEDVRRKCEKYLPEGGPQVGPGPQQVPLP